MGGGPHDRLSHGIVERFLMGGGPKGTARGRGELAGRNPRGGW